MGNYTASKRLGLRGLSKVDEDLVDKKRYSYMAIYIYIYTYIYIYIYIYVYMHCGLLMFRDRG